MPLPAKLTSKRRKRSKKQKESRRTEKNKDSAKALADKKLNLASENVQVFGKVLFRQKKTPAREVMIKCSYWNTRCLGDDFKREMTLETLNNLNKSEVITLTETKCKTKLVLIDKMVFQTDSSAKGGAVNIFSSKYARKIKALNQNVLWTTDRHDGALVHNITIYIPPNNAEMAEITVW